MTGRLPGLGPAELDPAQRALHDDMAANEVFSPGIGAAMLGLFRADGGITSQHAVDNATYLRAAREFGEAGILDMVVLIGLYLTVCAIVNAFEVPVPVGTQPESSTP